MHHSTGQESTQPTRGTSRVVLDTAAVTLTGGGGGCHGYLLNVVAVTVGAQVQAIPKQATGPLTVAEAQLIVLWFGQQGAHCSEHTEGGSGQGAPERRKRGKAIRDKTIRRDTPEDSVI